jgi:hypothetical protein
MVLVLKVSQVGTGKVLDASITTEAIVAHEMMKPKPLVCTPKLGPKLRITG